MRTLREETAEEDTHSVEDFSPICTQYLELSPESSDGDVLSHHSDLQEGSDVDSDVSQDMIPISRGRSRGRSLGRSLGRSSGHGRGGPRGRSRTSGWGLVVRSQLKSAFLTNQVFTTTTYIACNTVIIFMRFRTLSRNEHEANSDGIVQTISQSGFDSLQCRKSSFTIISRGRNQQCNQASLSRFGMMSAKI